MRNFIYVLATLVVALFLCFGIGPVQAQTSDCPGCDQIAQIKAQVQPYAASSPTVVQYVPVEKQYGSAGVIRRGFRAVPSPTVAPASPYAASIVNYGSQGGSASSRVYVPLRASQGYSSNGGQSTTYRTYVPADITPQQFRVIRRSMRSW